MIAIWVYLIPFIRTLVSEEQVILTILFEESDQQTSTPAFQLPDIRGDRVALSDYYEKGNLVLLFIPYDPTPSDLAAIKIIADHQKRIEAENAHLLALTPQPLDSLVEKQFSEVPVLMDKNSQIRAVYSGLIAPGLIGEGDIIIFILDTYGAPSVCLVGQEPVETIADEILSWLLYLSIQCPE